MAETYSTFDLKVGDAAPEFELPDAFGEAHELSDLSGVNGTLIVFACNHCPYVIHVAEQLGELAEKYGELGIATVAINSNDLQKYPQDGPEEMQEFAEEHGWDFAYLLDERQDLAKSYGAACTPDFFLFDKDLELAYAGQFDSSRPNSGEGATGEDMERAIEAVLEGETPEKGCPSSGCNIKWKPGNEPK